MYMLHVCKCTGKGGKQSHKAQTWDTTSLQTLLCLTDCARDARCDTWHKCGDTVRAEFRNRF